MCVWDVGAAFFTSFEFVINWEMSKISNCPNVKKEGIRSLCPLCDTKSTPFRSNQVPAAIPSHG